MLLRMTRAREVGRAGLQSPFNEAGAMLLRMTSELVAAVEKNYARLQ